MHELSVTENLLEIALRHAEKSGAIKINDLYIVVGQLSSIIDDSVQFYWNIISENTIATEAKLHFKRIPAEFMCNRCQSRFPFSNESFLCPECQSNELKIISGREFFLESMSIDTQDGH